MESKITRNIKVCNGVQTIKGKVSLLPDAMPSIPSYVELVDNKIWKLNLEIDLIRDNIKNRYLQTGSIE